jgi:hypothetical protein
MNSIYTQTNQENGDILLKKLNIDTNLYNIQKQKDNILLVKKKNEKISDTSDLDNYDFKKSTILKCSLDDEEIDKNKYKPILEKVYKLINNGTKIIKNTKLNIKTIRKEDEGFYYLDDIGISVQGVESNKCLNEIINQCISNEIDIKMTVELQNKIVVDIVF